MSYILPLSQDEVDNYSSEIERISTNVATNSIQCASLRVNIVGPRASLGERKNGHYIGPSEDKIIYPESKKNSYIFNGLEKVNIEIRGNINNILVRDCHDVRINIIGTTVSGVSILKCSRLTLTTNSQNTTTLEGANRIAIEGAITPDTIFYIQTSVDVIVNNEVLMINPFTQGIYIQGRFFPTRYIPPKLQTLLSP